MKGIGSVPLQISNWECGIYAAFFSMCILEFFISEPGANVAMKFGDLWAQLLSKSIGAVFSASTFPARVVAWSPSFFMESILQDLNASGASEEAKNFQERCNLGRVLTYI